MAPGHFFSLALVVVIAGCTLGSSPIHPRSKSPISFSNKESLADYELPDTISPLNYDLYVIPYLEHPTNNFTFDGEVNIYLRTEAETDLIRLHAHPELTITNVSLAIDGEEAVMDYTRAENDTHFLDVVLDQTLTRRAYHNLLIEFSGVLNDDLDGFYRSFYVDKEGKTRWMAVTQFAATGARRAFPCFDEPNKKGATFTLHVAHPPGYVALSNQAMTSETPMDDEELEGWMWSHFSTSLFMSTYLVAYTVSDQSPYENPEDSRFKVWVRSERLEQAKVASDISPKIIAFMEEYTNKIYSMQKMDAFTVPAFRFGAMENWGLVVYKESRLLFQEGVSPTSQRQLVELIVSHELAHQWFGNLVTLEWWDVVWLNEGFATYFESYTLSQLRPEWQYEEQFLYTATRPALAFDSLGSSHSMLVPNVASPASANAVFDMISYEKAASILRMVSYMMGADNFRNGIRQYITRRQFSITNMGILWNNLDDFMPDGILPEGYITLEPVMDTWTLQTGYPVIEVVRDYANNAANITQFRFFERPWENDNSSQAWFVPLTKHFQGQEEVDNIGVWVWHTGPELQVTDLPKSEEWFIVNSKQIGFYRVNYDSENWRLLINALNSANFNKIHPINRGQLVDDSMALAKSGILDYETALDLIGYLSGEVEYTPWATGLAAFSFLWDRLSYEQESSQLIKWFMLESLSSGYDLVNGMRVSSDDSNILRLKRELITPWACRVGHEECLTEANELFKADNNLHNISSTNPIDPDVRGAVYCTGMASGDREDYDLLMEAYVMAAHLVASEQTFIVNALGCASDTSLLQEYLEGSINSDAVIQGIEVFTAVCNNPLGVDLALDFLIAEWQEAAKFYGGLSGVGSAFETLSHKLNTQDHVDKLEAFLEANQSNLGEAMGKVEVAINNAEAAVRWHEVFDEEVLSYLRARGNAAATMSLSALLILSGVLCFFVMS